ncbi:deoxycytidylate deaminase [Streptomyces sp. NPDC004111]|uniref:deoxycytidylate deaminase n=1 Tax=Streptomyces sp. NPDC004111 TaxID=3364690 RepID=UPI0036972445
MSSPRPAWDEYFIAGAKWASTRADCTRSRVGALLVDAKNELIKSGYNGAPAGVPGCASAGACPRGRLTAAECAPDSDYSNCIADHAERNAIRRCPPRELPGATLYSTRRPCPACWTLIEAAGIHRAVWLNGDGGIESLVLR